MQNERPDPQHILLTAQRGKNPRRISDIAFGFAFVAQGIWGLATFEWSNLGWSLFGLIGCFGMGAAFLYSGLFSIWGQLRVGVDNGWCNVTWILGPYRRAVRFRQADIRRVARINDTDPGAWAILAGWQLRVDVAWRKRPIRIGGGLQLDEATLDGLERAIGPEHPRQMFER